MARLSVVVLCFMILAIVVSTLSAKRCPRNECVKKCGNPCDSFTTCDNPTPICTLQCTIGVCNCINGTIRAFKNGPCIPIKNCPKPCKY